MAADLEISLNFLVLLCYLLLFSVTMQKTLAINAWAGWLAGS
jgi:hypothetical protein